MQNLPIEERIPPQNLEAEMAVIGASMVDAEMFEVCSTHILPRDFYAHIHEALWQILKDLSTLHKPLDKVTVCEEMRRRGLYDKLGGIAYLSSLMDTVQSAASAEYYAKIVAEKSALRDIIRIGYEAVIAGYDEGQDIGPVAVANSLVSGLENAVTRHIPNQGFTGAEAALELEKHWLSSGTKRIALPWGSMNRALKRIGKKELTIWAGNPGQGKSAAALNGAHFSALHAADQGESVYYPLEMGRMQTTYRLCAMLTGIDAVSIEERSSLSSDQMGLVRGALRHISKLPLTIFDKRPTLDVPTMRLQLRKIKRARGLATVWIDHVGFFKEVQLHDNIHRAQTRIMEQCLEIADEFDCCIHLLMHISRIPRDKDGHIPKPTMFDLRGGGNAEGNAHNVIIVWRPDPKDDPTTGQFIVEKARSGGEGSYAINFAGGRNLWHELGVPESEWWFGRPDRVMEQSSVSLPYAQATSLSHTSANESAPGFETSFYEDHEFPTERAEQ